MIDDVRDTNDETLRMPLVEEQLVVGKRRIETGRVRVDIFVESTRQIARARLTRECFEIERVPVDRFVDVAPQPRDEGDTHVIPILEEVAVVVTRLRLVEEVRVTRKRISAPFEESVEVRRMRATVERTATPRSNQE